MEFETRSLRLLFRRTKEIQGQQMGDREEAMTLDTYIPIHKHH